MNKKRIWLIIPSFLLPYITLGMLALIFLSSVYAPLEFIVEKFFGSNIISMLVALLLFIILSVTLSVVCFVMSIRKKWDALSLAKTAMLIKLLQIPAYILIFVLGVALALTIFTILFTFVLAIIDIITLTLTGLITVSSVINAARDGIIEFKKSLWVVILQFFFCADVVAAIVFYVLMKKKLSALSSQ